MNRSRVCLFRSLIIVAIGLMLLSWFMPWWTCDILGLPLFNAVTIHPWGLSNILGEWIDWIVDALPPWWLSVIAWIFLPSCIGFLLYSLGMRGKKGKLLLGGVGCAYIAYAVAAVIYAAISTGDFGLSLQGYSFIHEDMGVPWETAVYAKLLPGYYLAHGVGVLCIVLALLRDRIIGKDKPIN